MALEPFPGKSLTFSDGRASSHPGTSPSSLSNPASPSLLRSLSTPLCQEESCLSVSGWQAALPASPGEPGCPGTSPSPSPNPGPGPMPRTAPKPRTPPVPVPVPVPAPPPSRRDPARSPVPAAPAAASLLPALGAGVRVPRLGRARAARPVPPHRHGAGSSPARRPEEELGSCPRAWLPLLDPSAARGRWQPAPVPSRPELSCPVPSRAVPSRAAPPVAERGWPCRALNSPGAGPPGPAQPSRRPGVAAKTPPVGTERPGLGTGGRQLPVLGEEGPPARKERRSCTVTTGRQTCPEDFHG